MTTIDPRTGHCDTFFKLIEQFKASFGDRFDSLLFPLPYSSGAATGAELRHARSGCELWEARGWQWVCQCPKQPSARLRFMMHSDAAELAGAGYRVTLDTGDTAGGKSNASAHSLSLADAETAQIEAIELPGF
jgi:hypothetical protein